MISAGLPNSANVIWLHLPFTRVPEKHAKNYPILFMPRALGRPPPATISWD